MVSLTHIPSVYAYFDNESRKDVKKITKPEINEAHMQADRYRDWFQKSFLPVYNDDSRLNAIMVNQWTQSLQYRDTLEK